MTQLIITDDNPRDRTFLAEVLSQYTPVMTANADEAIAACSGSDEPWLVTDIQMPGGNGIELARQIWASHRTARILFWSQHSDETYVRALAKLIPAETVYGYVLKNNPAETLLNAARTVFEDCQCWIDPHVRRIQARSQRSSDALSDAEYEVLVDIALGLTDKTIAERRFLSRRGAQNRLQSLYAKLGANLEHADKSSDSELLNVRARAVALALQRGLINAFELKEEEQHLEHWLASRKENS
ncbi:response regulator transcription factor [Sulfuriflexus mobilis]|uniref:response regulator transcription factor n=1 Tax=Sulfuriflexus mobilis TaxID=1811807 RepID=UPI0018D58966|nr:response regulator transcription factor [Sulfuriflexus mobilis]